MTSLDVETLLRPRNDKYSAGSLAHHPKGNKVSLNSQLGHLRVPSREPCCCVRVGRNGCFPVSPNFVKRLGKLNASGLGLTDSVWQCNGIRELKGQSAIIDDPV